MFKTYLSFNLQLVNPQKTILEFKLLQGNLVRIVQKFIY